MDIEMAVISRAIQVGEIEKLTAEGIEERHFHDIACREIFKTCAQYARTWGVSPPIDAVKRRHPDFKILPVSEELDPLIDEFRNDCAYKSGLQKWQDIGNLLDKADPNNEVFDPEARGKVVELFMEHAREMAILIPIPRSSRYSDMAQRITTQRQQQEEGIKPGVSLGIPALEPYVYAVRPTEFVVHAAYSQHGKTTGEVRSAIQAYQEGDNVMFVSLEMEDAEIWELFDASAAGLGRKAMSRRELGEQDWVSYQRAAERVAAASNDIIVFDELPGGATIDRLAAYVERYKPDTVCVDYISLMEPMARGMPKWEGVAEISRGLKKIARMFNIRVYAAAQNTRDAMVDGPTEDNIAHSNTIFQDCNIMVGYWQDSEMAKKNQVQVRLVKNRGADKPHNHAMEYWDRDKLIFEDWTKQHEWRTKLESTA